MSCVLSRHRILPHDCRVLLQGVEVTARDLYFARLLHRKEPIEVGSCSPLTNLPSILLVPFHLMASGISVLIFAASGDDHIVDLLRAR